MTVLWLLENITRVGYRMRIVINIYCKQMNSVDTLSPLMALLGNRGQFAVRYTLL